MTVTTKSKLSEFMVTEQRARMDHDAARANLETSAASRGAL
jgi:hypothetical protein